MDEDRFYSVDENLFNHINNKQIRVLGIINNITKSFRSEDSLNRTENTLKKFIQTFVLTDNSIISNRWAGYQFLGSRDPDYQHVATIHSIGSFRMGIQSSSHIKAIWNIIKSKIKSSYHVIPQQNMLHFI